MNFVAFYTQTPITKIKLENFLADNLQVANFFWFTDFDEAYFKALYALPNDTIFIQYQQIGNTGFCHVYEFSNLSLVLDFEGIIEWLSHLAKTLDTPLMTSDDEIGYYSMTVIDKDGKCFWGILQDNENDELILTACESPLIASFYYQTRLTLEEENQLRRLFQAYYPDVYVEYEYCGLSQQTDLLNRFNEDILSQFNHRYRIYPIASKTWKSKKQRTELSIAVFSAWQKSYPDMIFLFPADYYKVENVKGGSDSREYCIVSSKKGIDKIEYKQPKDYIK